MARAKPKERTLEQLLVIASTAKRIDEVTFEIPSESNPGKIWHVNIMIKTCRDQDGNGCHPMFYYGTCKHFEASLIILNMLRKWSLSHG